MILTINDNVKRFIDQTIYATKTNDKITVLPLPCGTGKSSFVKQKINESIHQNKGLIVVTDSLERMHNYACSDVIAEYLDRINRRKIAILESATISNALQTLDKKPVVILSTQRFFSMTRDEIIALTKFNHYHDNTINQSTWQKRDLIIFDEMPFLLEHIIVDTATLNDIDTSLKMLLDDTINQSDKLWLINQWQTISDTLQNAFKDVESANDGYEHMQLYTPLKQDITDNDANFLRLCAKYKKNLNQRDYQTYKKIIATMQIFKDGGTLISRKLKNKKPTTENEYRTYHNYCHVTIDNQDKLTDINANVIVLDGTADLTPDYHVDYVKMVDCTDYAPDLSNLTINIVSAPTSKTRLCSGAKQSQKLIDGILKYIDNQPDKPDAIFGYKALTDYIVNHYQYTIPYAYFGNIKGRNDFRTCSNIVQIGLNRFPQDYYNLTAFFIQAQNVAKRKREIDAIRKARNQQIQSLKRPKKNPISISLVYHKPIGDSEIELKKGKYIDSIIYLSILTDIEQNLFRCRIRNQDNQLPVKYTLFFDTYTYAGLIDKIRERYESKGAKVNVIDTPNEILLVKTQNRKPKDNSGKTKSQILLDWLQSRQTEFKLAEMLDSTGIKRGTYNDITKRHPEIRQILDQMRTEKKGYYNPKNQK